MCPVYDYGEGLCVVIPFFFLFFLMHRPHSWHQLQLTLMHFRLPCSAVQRCFAGTTRHFMSSSVLSLVTALFGFVCMCMRVCVCVPPHFPPPQACSPPPNSAFLCVWLRRRVPCLVFLRCRFCFKGVCMLRPGIHILGLGALCAVVFGALGAGHLLCEAGYCQDHAP